MITNSAAPLRSTERFNIFQLIVFGLETYCKSSKRVIKSANQIMSVTQQYSIFLKFANILSLSPKLVVMPDSHGSKNCLLKGVLLMNKTLKL